MGPAPIAVALFVLLAWPAAQASAQSLTIETTADSLKIRAAGFSFLQGDPLARLKDGRSVRVELTAQVLPAPGKPVVAAARRIFALSYDLWEERFAVTTVEKRSQSMTHLTLAAAEAWCIDQLAIPRHALGTFDGGQPFWVRLEYRILETENPQDSADSGFTLQALIDLLSRVRKSDSPPQGIDAGPFTVRRGGSSSPP